MDSFETTIIVLIAILLAVFIAGLVISIVCLTTKSAPSPIADQRMYLAVMEVNNLTDLMLRFVADNKELCNLDEQMSGALATIGQQMNIDPRVMQLWTSLIESVLRHRDLTTDTLNMLRQQFPSVIGNALYNWLHDIVLYGKVVGSDCNLAAAYRSAAFEHGAHLVQQFRC